MLSALVLLCQTLPLPTKSRHSRQVNPWTEHESKQSMARMKEGPSAWTAFPRSSHGYSLLISSNSAHRNYKHKQTNSHIIPLRSWTVKRQAWGARETAIAWGLLERTKSWNSFQTRSRNAAAPHGWDPRYGFVYTKAPPHWPWKTCLNTLPVGELK